MSRERPAIRKKLEPKVWSDEPMKGWKERGDEDPPAYVRESLRLGVQRLKRRFPGLHYGHARQVEEGFQADCQCGWKGPVRDARLTADTDAARHELRAREPGPYA